MGVRDDLLKTSTLATQAVSVPGVGEVTVRALKAGELLEVRQACLIRGKKGRVTFDAAKFQRLLVARSVVENGQRVFSDADIPAIDEMASTAVEPIADAARKLCGIMTDDEDDLGEACSPAAPGD